MHVRAECFAERGSRQAREEDSAYEAQQAEELTDESAKCAPDGEEDQQGDAEDVEGHLSSSCCADAGGG